MTNMMRYYFLLFFILLCNDMYALDKNFSELKTANNATELSNILHEHSTDYLVIWDVDEVLITPTDRIFHTNNCINDLPSKYAKAAIEKYFVSKEQAQWNGSQMLLQRNMRLVEKEIVSIIQGLQKDKIKTIALTKHSIGSYGAIASLEDFRIKQLQDLGIDFNSAFPKYDILVLNNVKNTSSQYPIFKKGLLFTNAYTKGETLEAFLNKIKWNPAKVIFIDDLRENLISVQQVLQNKNIAYTGVLYTAAEKLPDEIDKDVVEKQYEYLVQKGIWLSDSEAERLLKTK